MPSSPPAGPRARTTHYARGGGAADADSDGKNKHGGYGPRPQAGAVPWRAAAVFVMLVLGAACFGSFSSGSLRNGARSLALTQLGAADPQGDDGSDYDDDATRPGLVQAPAQRHAPVVMLPTGKSQGLNSGVVFAKAGFHCIPPERATDWVAVQEEQGEQWGEEEEEEEEEAQAGEEQAGEEQAGEEEQAAAKPGGEEPQAEEEQGGSEEEQAEEGPGGSEDEDEKDATSKRRPRRRLLAEAGGGKGASSKGGRKTGAKGGKKAAAKVAAEPADDKGRGEKLTEVKKAAKEYSKFKIALVNDVEFHHEVTLGLMQALQAHRDRLKVYLNKALFSKDPSKDSSHGLLPYINRQLPNSTVVNAYHKQGITKADVAVFVSPEFNIGYVREFIAAARPRMVVMFIHEPSMDMKRLRYLVTLHPFTAIATLSPHVAEVLNKRLDGSDVHWMLPTLPAGCQNACLEGFAVQGKFEASRRTYDSLWKAMAQYVAFGTHAATAAEDRAAAAAGGGGAPAAGDGAAADDDAATADDTAADADATADVDTADAEEPDQGDAAADRRRRLAAHTTTSSGIPTTTTTSGNSSRHLSQAADHVPLPRINVIGSGSLNALKLPRRLAGSVFVYQGLSYADYYDTVCRSIALLPLFNEQSGYMKDKISSSVLASLATATPLMVPPAFLRTYSYFKPEHVMLMEDGATELGAMLRLMNSSALSDTLSSRRKALRRLRFVLNSQAAAKLDGLMQAAEGRPSSAGKDPPALDWVEGGKGGAGKGTGKAKVQPKARAAEAEEAVRSAGAVGGKRKQGKGRKELE